MYEKQEWIDCIKDEHGNVVVAGTPYNKRRMDHIEKGIEDAHKLVEDMDTTPENIGAAPEDHTHTPEDIGAALSEHTHTPEAVGAAPVQYTYTVTLLADGWDSKEGYYEQSVSLVNLPENASIQGAIGGLSGTASKEQIEEASKAILQLVSITSKGIVCIRAYGKLPTTDIPICIHTI